MSTYTKNYNLKKPELTDTSDITQYNESWDKVDEVLNDFEETRNIKTYTSLEQLGLDKATATMLDIIKAIPPNSMLMFEMAQETYNRSEYPKNYGSVRIYHTHHLRVSCEFDSITSSANSVVERFIGNGISNGDSSVWSGWQEDYNESNPPTAEQVGALPITGGTLTGNDIFVVDGHGRFGGSSGEISVQSWNNKDDSKNVRGITIKNKTIVDSVADSLVYRDRINNVDKDYKLYGEHNKPTASDVGAVSVTDSSKEITLERLNTSTEDLQGYINNTTATNIGFENIWYSVWSHYNGGNKTQIFIPLSAYASKAKMRVVRGDTLVYAGDLAYGFLPLDGSVAMSGRELKLNGGNGVIDMNHNAMWIHSRPTKDSMGLARTLTMYNANYRSDKTTSLQLVESDSSGKGTAYNIFGEHNKPSGSYTGNGSATERTINVGGIGDTLKISTGNALVFVDTKGAVCIHLTNKSINYFTESEVKFVNGVLTIATGSGYINNNGSVYNYQVL